jgi:hypothetical protein
MTIRTLVFAGLALSAAAHAQQPMPASVRRMVDSVSQANLTTHVRQLERAGGHFSRVRHTVGDDSAVAYILREFRSIPNLTSVGVDTFSIAPKTGFTTRQQTSIVATLAGTQNPARVFVVGAHHDASGSRMSGWTTQWNTAKIPGADDNATGVAIILEMARLMSDPAFGYRPAWTIRFVAFAAEESSLADNTSHAGSRRQAQVSKTAQEDVAGMVSVDMVGYNPGYHFQSIIANPASEPLARKFIAANDSVDIALTLGLKVDAASTYSDHDTYWAQGYQAVCLIEYAPPWNSGPTYTANPYYHTPGDSSQTVNFTLVRKVAQLTLAAVGMMASPMTGVDGRPDGQLPLQLALEQNFPNPFNPTTMITYAVPAVADRGSAGSHVRLALFDLLGRELAVLVDETKAPGNYTIPLYAAGMASGSYVYRLTAGGSSVSRRMTLVR